MLIKKAYDTELNDIKIDHSLFKKIVMMESNFVTKHPDHINFFGGSLTGVQVIRFTSEDRDILFTDIIRNDEVHLQNVLYSLRDSRGVPVIDTNRKVSSDIFSLTCVWLIHGIQNSKYLSDTEKEEGKIRVCMYMLYRFLTSRLYRHFIYPADEGSAKATYESLSGKYILKQKGSWAETIRYLSVNAVSTKGIHSDVVLKMDDDNRVINMLNDVQGRIRDMLKNIYGEFIKIHQQGIKITKNSSFVELDGEIVLKDKLKSLSNYSRYIKSIIPDKDSFIKQELIDVISDMMHTMPEKLLVHTLEWCSSNYSHMRDNSIEETIDAIMEHAFFYLSNDKSLLHNRGDISTIIAKLRGAYMSSRSTEEKVILAKKLSDEIVSLGSKSKNDSVLNSTRTGFMLYIVLRSITMKHYSN
jgi:hypothetical protein